MQHCSDVKYDVFMCGTDSVMSDQRLEGRTFFFLLAIKVKSGVFRTEYKKGLSH